MKEQTYALSEINRFATDLLPELTTKVVVFEGEMGMGKTTLIKALVSALGIDEVTASPTFGLVNHYENEAITVYHFDFYRVEDEDEAFEIGVDEYFYSGHWCFLEWAERIPIIFTRKIYETDVFKNQ